MAAKPKDDKVYLNHILEAINKIETYIDGASYEDLLEETLLLDAVVREIEIIGEATKNISPEFKKKHQDAPWPKMAGIRNKLIHEYFSVDEEIVWKTATKNLPKLKKIVKTLLYRPQ